MKGYGDAWRNRRNEPTAHSIGRSAVWARLAGRRGGICRHVLGVCCTRTSSIWMARNGPRNSHVWRTKFARMALSIFGHKRII